MGAGALPFPGRRLVDALVDLPFALPTAVAGIALTAVYSKNGWLGALLEPLGIQVAFTPLGRHRRADVHRPAVRRAHGAAGAGGPRAEVEEAAATLGATRWQTFRRVILPTLLPALLTGFALAFARALGEYGSVVFISGNMPMKTEIAPLLIIDQARAVRLRRRHRDRRRDAARSRSLLLLAINLLQCVERGGARGRGADEQRDGPRSRRPTRRRRSEPGAGSLRARLIGVALVFLGLFLVTAAGRRLRRRRSRAGSAPTSRAITEPDALSRRSG